MYDFIRDFRKSWMTGFYVGRRFLSQLTFLKQPEWLAFRHIISNVDKFVLNAFFWTFF